MITIPQALDDMCTYWCKSKSRELFQQQISNKISCTLMKELQQIDTIGEGDAEYKQVVVVLLFLLNEREVTKEVWFGLVCDRQTHVISA